MTRHPIIVSYQSLADISSRMRNLAVSGEWQQFIELNSERDRLIGTLKVPDANTSLDNADIRVKQQLIERVLADDAETRRLVDTWMAQLESDLRENRQQLRLLKEYSRLG